MNQWRIAQMEGRFEDSGPLCTKCNWRSAGGYPAEEAHTMENRMGATKLLAIRLDNLRKTYHTDFWKPSFEAVKGISLEVQKESHLALLVQTVLVKQVQ